MVCQGTTVVYDCTQVVECSFFLYKCVFLVFVLLFFFLFIEYIHK